MLLRKNRRGAIAFGVLLSLIIIVLSFLVILFLYWQFNWKGEIDKQVCHESVVFKVTVPGVLDRKAVDLPLRCKTEKICISDKLIGGECEGFVGEKNINLERVSGDEEKQVEEIKEIIANSIYDCWWMMGEGKVNVFSREFAGGLYSSRCVICARIDFDDDLKESLKVRYPQGIPGIMQYLDTNEISGTDLTFSEYLTGFKEERPYGKYLDSTSDHFSIEQQAIIFQEFDRTTMPEDLTGVVTGIASAVGVGFATSNVKLSAVSFFGGGYVGRKLGGLIGGSIGDEYLATWIFVPFKISSDLDTELVNNVEKEDGICYSKIDDEEVKELFGDKLYYGFSDENKFVRFEKGFWGISGQEEVVFPDENDKSKEAFRKRELLNQITKELTIVCYDLKSLQCGQFESLI